MKKISMVIPVKDEERIINPNVKRLKEYLKKAKIDYEIIFIENGSSDNTIGILKELVKKDKKIKYITLPKASYGGAIKAGVMKAKHDVFIYSIDLTMGLKFIERGVKALEKYPLVNGSRYIKESHIERNMLRHWVSRFYMPLINVLFKSEYSDFDGIRAFRRDIGKRIMKKTRCPRNFFLTEMLIIASNSKLPFIEIPINHVERRNSRFNFPMLVVEQIFDLIANYDRLKKLKV